MRNSGIEWCDDTWNPIRGCSRISAGCMRCYAEAIAGRFSDPGQAFHGFATRKLVVVDDDTSRHEGRWTGAVQLLVEKLGDPLRCARGRRIFVNSTSDLFHEKLEDGAIACVFVIMAAAQQHTFIALTKRAARMRAWFDAMVERAGLLERTMETIVRLATEWLDANEIELGEKTWGEKTLASASAAPWPLPNLWIGTSVESQDETHRLDELDAVPAAVHVVSAEPLLGPLDLTPWLLRRPTQRRWVIAGCESGIGSRRCDFEWLRALRDQCYATRTAYFLKQAEIVDECVEAPPEYPDPIVTTSGRRLVPIICAEHVSDIKRSAGRRIVGRPLLDGRHHAEFPRPSA